MTVAAATMSVSEHQLKTNARLAAVQALYQLEQGGMGVETVIAEFLMHRLGEEIDGIPLHEADRAFFSEIVRGVVRTQTKIDPFLQSLLTRGWALTRLNATTRAILRAGLFELGNFPKVPARAAVNEYVEVGRAFFDDTEAGFVNAVLDNAARQLRVEEFADGHPAR